MINSVEISKSNRSVAGNVVHKFSGKSQNALLLLHMIKFTTITQWEAHGLYRVARLASRITDIRNAGVLIERVTKYDATGRRYAEYRLAR